VGDDNIVPLMSLHVKVDAVAKECEALEVLVIAGGEKSNGPGLIHTTLRSISAQSIAPCWRENSILVESCNNESAARPIGLALRALDPRPEQSHDMASQATERAAALKPAGEAASGALGVNRPRGGCEREGVFDRDVVE